MPPTEEHNHEERAARIDRMLKELAEVQQLARRLAQEVHDRSDAIAKELAAMKASEQAAVKKPESN